jgi:hypothetical protein
VCDTRRAIDLPIAVAASGGHPVRQTITLPVLTGILNVEVMRLYNILGMRNPNTASIATQSDAIAHLLELDDMGVQQLAVIDDLGLHILVDVLAPSNKLYSYVRALVQLVFRKLHKAKRASVQVLSLLIPFVV